MKHNIEINTIDSLVILNALREFETNKKHNATDILIAMDISNRVRETVAKDLNTLEREK